MKISLFACLLLVASVCVAPAAEMSWETPKDFGKFLQSERIYPDWKGLVFMCDIDESKPLEKKICQNFTLDLELLCSTYNIPYKVVKPNNNYAMAFDIQADTLMPIELRLTTNDVTGQDAVTGIYGELISDLWFTDAVSADDVFQKKVVRPRSGDLVMYSDFLIGTGSVSDLATDVNNALETMFKKFLVQFKKNNKAHLKSVEKGS
jgi:hypothetical protein